MRAVRTRVRADRHLGQSRQRDAAERGLHLRVRRDAQSHAAGQRQPRARAYRAEGPVTRARAVLFGVCWALSSCASPSPAVGPAATPSPASAWTLTWSDEFDGPAGATIDATHWTFDVGGGGWGNKELEPYTDRPKNAHLSGDGSLVIDVLREPFTGPDGIARDFTSARLKSQGLFAQAYGRFEARMKLPKGQGLWPAFWMLGSDITSVGWPACGEIDIMENVGFEPGIAHGTIHGPGYSGAGG